MSAKKKDPKDLVLAIARAKRSGKLAYERADRLLNELATLVTPGEEVKLNDAGRAFILHDKYDEASHKNNIIWTPCAARRWELEIIEP